MAKRSKKVVDTAVWLARRDAIMAQALTVNFQVFALLWCEFITSYGAVDGYTVKRSGDRWALAFNGVETTVGDARTIYGWLERSPLRHLAIEANDARAEASAA